MKGILQSDCKEIEFSVDVQNRISEIKYNFGDKSSGDAKQFLKAFQHHVNENANDGNERRWAEDHRIRSYYILCIVGNGNCKKEEKKI